MAAAALIAIALFAAYVRHDERERIEERAQEAREKHIEHAKEMRDEVESLDPDGLLDELERLFQPND